MRLLPYRFKGDHAAQRTSCAPTCSTASRRTRSGIQMRHMIGVDNLLWGSDYPHAESTFPESQRILSEILEGVPEDEQDKIVGSQRREGVRLRIEEIDS